MSISATFVCTRCGRAIKLAERHPSGRCFDCQKKLDAGNLAKIQQIQSSSEGKRVARRRRAKKRAKLTRPYFLYRLYTTKHVLLYVGITYNVHERFYGSFKTAHSKDKAWWPEVEYVRVERFISQVDAEEAERWAIHYEDPIHNKDRKLPARKIEPKALSAITGSISDIL